MSGGQLGCIAYWRLEREEKKSDSLELEEAWEEAGGERKGHQTSSGQEKGLGLAAAQGSGQALAGIFEMLCSGWEERWIKSMKSPSFPSSPPNVSTPEQERL